MSDYVRFWSNLNDLTCLGAYVMLSWPGHESVNLQVIRTRSDLVSLMFECCGTFHVLRYCTACPQGQGFSLDDWRGAGMPLPGCWTSTWKSLHAILEITLLPFIAAVKFQLWRCWLSGVGNFFLTDLAFLLRCFACVVRCAKILCGGMNSSTCFCTLAQITTVSACWKKEKVIYSILGCGCLFLVGCRNAHSECW